MEREVEFTAGRPTRLSVDLATGSVGALPPTAEDLAAAGALEGGTRAIKSICFTPDGRLLAAVEWHRPAVLLWDVERGCPFAGAPAPLTRD